MKLLILDNYDSFVYNIVHIIRALGYSDQLQIFRNDKIQLEEVASFDKILLSPGPGIPSEAGIMRELVQTYGSSKSIFGVCLGHQCIGEVYGASLTNLSEVYHGLAIPTNIIKQDKLFKNIPSRITCGRYHSWAINPSSNLENIEITAQDDEGNIMAIRHKSYNVCGVQFHPESVMTEHGVKIIQNWLED
ncbi:MAG: aminodeoxychorismate/anthranilate synthase component II [Cytophagales bacterium]|nr:MAG: aminodeoxychorismate/anthranilate synthase component II [Cytophagales bacterium]